MCTLLISYLQFYLPKLSYRYIETPFRREGLKAFSFNYLKRPKFIRTIVSIIAVIPIVLLFLGVFDRFGKDEIDNKANSFNTNDQDKYLVRMMPGENIKIDGSSSNSKSKNKFILILVHYLLETQ